MSSATSGNSVSRSRVGRMLSGTGTVLASTFLSRNRLWIGPAGTALLIIAIGWWASRSVESSVRLNLADQLQALLNADVAALEYWIDAQRSAVATLAHDDRVSTAVASLIEVAESAPSSSQAGPLLASQELAKVRQHFQQWSISHPSKGFLVLNRDLSVIAGDLDMGIGDPNLFHDFDETLKPVFAGETILIPPFRSRLALPDSQGIPQAGAPVMLVVAPMLRDSGEVMAAFCLRLAPEAEFTRILQVARAGVTGETYAFNRAGTLLTNSRFDIELKQIGLLPDDDFSRSLLNIDLRDPGVDMTKGKRPNTRRPEQPLTRMASAAVDGQSGVDVVGYRDYRGVEVVGAWKWLTDHGFGVATEVDAAEAFRPLRSLRIAFGALAALLFAMTIGLFGLTFYAAQLERRARYAALDARRLGQYSLDQKIGQGGMGIVYRGHHDMLHRPTAIKLLNIDQTNEATIARFEQEVQLTSQLSHPNTIEIYDFGRTEEGVFYYVMEYLDGIALDDVVESFGPMPESRVIFILRQLCGSLAEAHGRSLIHRDIKPANIMLTRLGGLCDFVKLLDFGLVKPQFAVRNITVAGSLTGTPMFMSPEALQRRELDARSDLYAVGAVGYYLLTGKPVFDSEGLLELCRAHIETPPVPPSEQLGKPIERDLEELILQCLAKAPDDRPRSAEFLEEQLAACISANHWTQRQAKRWWAANIHEDSDLVESPNSTANRADTDDDDLAATIIHDA